MVMLNNESCVRTEFRVRYFVKSPDPLQNIAKVIAGGQSSGTFLELPGETAELKVNARDSVTRIEPHAPALEPALRSEMVARRDHRAPFQRGQIEIAFPQANVGANLSTLLAKALTEKPGQSVIVKKTGRGYHSGCCCRDQAAVRWL